MSTDRPKAQTATTSYPQAVDRLIAALATMPGVGRRSAERIAFHLLKAPEPEAMGLARAIEDVKRTITHCARCWNLTDVTPGTPRDRTLCPICADPRRDGSTLMVVEQPKDLIALEQTGMYKGRYHVLMGRISPLEGVRASELTIPDLLRRLDGPEKAETPENGEGLGSENIREVILALNPTVEGDGTGLYLAEEIRRRGRRVTRLARGLPSGSQLEYANKAVLADAILGRQGVE